MKQVRVQPKRERDESVFPYHLPLFRQLKELPLTSPVTFLIGENGSGKSTLLEAIACGANSITAGMASIEEDPFYSGVKEFALDLQLVWKVKTKRGFFLRAEDFLSYTKGLHALQEELQVELQRVEREYAGRSRLTQQLARSAYENELHGLRTKYQGALHERSHGEGFFSFFQSRIHSKGLYLLDEPEAALSPTKQLALLSLMKQATEEGSQFIVATHSPILMAYPEATRYVLGDHGVKAVAYDEIEHVQLTKAFLEAPERFLRHL